MLSLKQHKKVILKPACAVAVFHLFWSSDVASFARYLMQQGYTGERDIVILTPYVGQLLRLKKAVAVSNMRVILSERDTDELAVLEDSEEAAAAAAVPSGLALDPGSGLPGSSSSSSSASNSGATGSLGGGTVRVVAMESCLRLATIDNFQARLGPKLKGREHTLARGANNSNRQLTANLYHA